MIHATLNKVVLVNNHFSVEFMVAINWIDSNIQIVVLQETTSLL